MAEELGMLKSIDIPDIESIGCHAFSRGEKLLAISPCDERVIILKAVGDDFKVLSTLTKHTQRVTGLDWSCHDRLVSVSEDRVGYVWTWSDDISEFRGSAAEISAPRAALCVAWSPDGLRFAVGLSSKDVSICHYEDAVRCWVPQKVGRAKASEGAITSVAWHPSSSYLATGSTDRRCIVYDTVHRGADFGKPELVENVNAWVNCVAFSTAGTFLVLASQDSTLRFKQLLKGPAEPLEVVQWRGLPFLRAVFLAEQCLVACGFDCQPVIFVRSEQWAFERAIEVLAAPTSSLNEKRDSYLRATGSVPGPGRLQTAGHTNPV
eukprot:6390696-Amphidinium_carterae.1